MWQYNALLDTKLYWLGKSICILGEYIKRDHIYTFFFLIQCKLSFFSDLRINWSVFINQPVARLTAV